MGITPSFPTEHPFILPIVANELETTCPSKTPAFPLHACRFTYVSKASCWMSFHRYTRLGDPSRNLGCNASTFIRTYPTKPSPLVIFTIGASISESQNFARPFLSCSIISDPYAREPSWINFAILVPFHHHVCPSSTITAIPSCALPSYHTLLRFGNDDKEAVLTASLGDRYKCSPSQGICLAPPSAFPGCGYDEAVHRIPPAGGFILHRPSPQPCQR